MPITITPPNPGDLITARFMQDLITQLTALDTRLTTVEQLIPGAGGKLVITDISPTLPVSGTEIRISGANFGTSIGGTLVTFNGGSPRTSFKAGSNDHLLIVDLPTFNITGTDLPVTVAVSNSNNGGFDTRTITVSKPVQTVPNGTMVVSQVAWPTVPNNIIPTTGGAFVFPFKAELVVANLDETYNVEVVLPAGWSWKLTADATGLVETPGSIFMAKPPSGGPTLVTPLFVKVTIPATTALTGTINVTVRSSRNSTYLGTSGTINIPIGTVLPGMGTIFFELPPTASGAGSSTNGAEAAFTVPTPAHTSDHLTLRAQGLKAGLDYQVTIAWKNQAANGWAATLGSDVTTPLMTKTFTQAQAGLADTGIVLSAAGQATSATLQIAIRAVLQPTVEFGSVELVVKPA